MADTRYLTDHDEVRDWAAARMGSPAIVDVSPESGTQPLLRIVFGSAAYQDQDRADRPQNAGGFDFVEWSDWFKVFDEASLALAVNPEVPGRKDAWYDLVSRD